MSTMPRFLNASDSASDRSCSKIIRRRKKNRIRERVLKVAAAQVVLAKVVVQLAQILIRVLHIGAAIESQLIVGSIR